ADDYEEEDDEDLQEEQGADSNLKFEQREVSLCLSCGRTTAFCNCDKRSEPVVLYEVQVNNKKKRRGVESIQTAPLSDLNECPRCRSKAKSGTEIATPISIGGTGTLANLTYELYRKLPPSSDLDKRKMAGSGRKLLSFYDSRQGAARFAAFLQDVSNKQNYRHIIPKAVEQCMQPDEWGEPTRPSLVSLSQKSAEIAWKNDIIKNDSDTDQWRKRDAFSQQIRKEISKFMATKILSEFTTGRRSRQSLESMGLVGVSYFAEDKRPDFSSLADTISLSEEQSESLVSNLLDDLRNQKVITLPTGVIADDPEFGQHKGHPRIIREGKTNYGEIPWIGATERQQRKRYIKKVLADNQLDTSEYNVRKTLNEIWEWLLSVELLEGSSYDGYRLNHNQMYFDTNQEWLRCDKCQRLSYRGSSLPCPQHHCGGQYQTIDIDFTQESNYYYNLFRQDLIPLRVEEHTAQLDSEKGREYQNLFKRGHVNVLSCSTTFEMGIDLGDLQTVVMSNVPPTVANYRQRAGRAGRRTSGTAFILTRTSDRPHDQTYYNSPIDIISGEVRVPNIILENELILQRHVNAILLSQFLRFRKRQGVEDSMLKTSGDFFDRVLHKKPHYLYLDEWISEDTENIHKRLKEYADFLPSKVHHVIENGIDNFKSDLRILNDNHYQPITSYYVEQIDRLGDMIKDTTLSYSENKRIHSQIKYFQVLLQRTRGGVRQSSGYLINYLSNKGVLPSYSFPLHTVELLLPKDVKDSEHLSLERDLRQAITEYAPGSEIVADKRIWKSKQPLFWQDTPPVHEYR
ncbi:MAG: hypothetical protein GX849_08185, partial [Clostridiaceae bacterium]|nr:hypothetical protein [Clostridiaceae bacterium]